MTHLPCPEDRALPRLSVRRLRRQQGGITLIEVLVAIAIIAVLIGDPNGIAMRRLNDAVATIEDGHVTAGFAQLGGLAHELLGRLHSAPLTPEEKEEFRQLLLQALDVLTGFDAAP